MPTASPRTTPAHARWVASRWRSGLRGVLALLILCVVIGGCAPADSPTARFDDYLTRLARTLNRDLAPAITPTYRGYPQRRTLRQHVDTPRTGWIGLFELHRCGLVNLIAQRNSVLGRVAPPHTRLAYESRLLARLRACRVRQSVAGEADADFMSRLDALIARKQSGLGATLWNQSFATTSMAHLFSVAGDDAGLEPTLAGQASRRALAQLTGALRAIQHGQEVSAQTLAPAYETLDKSEYGGALQIAAVEAATALERARATLQTRLDARPICFNGRPSRRGRILRTILLDIYGQRVQPYLADLVRAGRLWRATVDGLIAAQDITPMSAFVDYRAETLAADTGVWARLDHAIAEHTDLWQSAMRQCDLMPGNAGRQ